MLIVLMDEPGLFVYSSAEVATRNIELIDAENEIRAAYDDSAVPYRVERLKPSGSRGLVARVLSNVEPETYHFVPCGPADPAALVELISNQTDYTDPPEAKHDLQVLLGKLGAT